MSQAVSPELPESLGPALIEALTGKGYTTLTTVQHAVLDPMAIGRDLRITSQTGSGKTIAIGFVLRDLVMLPAQRPSKAAKPRALIIVPTRELGRQVEEELGWLYTPLGARVVALTGGASYRDEHRALALLPTLVVGTPGRLIDHLEHGSLDPSAIAAVVLDEADRMLDMGFTEALDTILTRVPEGRRTHLVSATFQPEVRHLADRVQSSPLHVEGTRLGVANADIEHIVYLVDPRERLDALINLLLAHPDARTLVFAKTRAGVAELAEALGDVGFSVAALSGEMAQRERTRALTAFKRGSLRILVATDVAARGIDVSDVSLVLHMEAPNDSDSYTHRSGRTGRAGRKGTSAMLVAPREIPRAQRIVRGARVQARIEPMPTPSEIRAMEDERLVALLTGDDETIEIDPRTASIAARIAEKGSPERTLARLLAETGLTRGPEPRAVRVIAPPGSDRDRGHERNRPGERTPRTERYETRTQNDTRGQSEPRTPSAPRTQRPPPMAPMGEGSGADSGPPPPLPIHDASRDFVPFQVSWGERNGADTRRLLAIACRRGDIESKDVGAIRIGPASSLIEVRAYRAEAFAEAAARPDPRDPRVRFRRYQPELASAGPPARTREREERPRPAPRGEDRPRPAPRGAPPRHEGHARSGEGGNRPPKRR
jgi:ATP-dependent RNA helicase DeaD